VRLARLRSIDTNLLVALDALLDECSVTRAADRMGVSQSAMSRTLARLRELVGDPLLVRTAHEMERTPVAEDLREPLREALSQLEALVTEREAFDPLTSSRSFRLEITDHAAVAVLPRLMPRLRELAPRVDLEVAPPEGKPEARLLERRTELFIGGLVLDRRPRRAPLQGPSAIGRSLRRDRRALVAPPRQPNPRHGSNSTGRTMRTMSVARALTALVLLGYGDDSEVEPLDVTWVFEGGDCASNGV
jgi:DNA-binding transcriptional LysR family regulator